MQGQFPTSPAQPCDALIIGGGPAGTTIATLLARQGWQVVLLEKDYHPRFHIGESLLPMNLPIFERLGVLEEVRRIGVLKYGAEFNSPRIEGWQTFYFSEALNKNHPLAFQVKRDEFDQILFNHCLEKGVDARQGVNVTGINREPLEVTALGEDGTEQLWRPRYLVDASGRDTFLARRLNWKIKNPKHHSAAIFGHYKNVDRRPGEDEGNISIYWFEHGWFWMIPLREGLMSVGAVCWPEYLKTRTGSPEVFFEQALRLCPGVWERMQHAELAGKVNVTGNYTYRARQMSDASCLLVGDAFAFLDPVFSSGVYLAMAGAEQGAKVVDAYLRGDPAAPRLMLQHTRRLEKSLNILSWFIYRFTSPAMHYLFMKPGNVFRVKEAVISMLAGDIFDNPSIFLRLWLFKSIYYFLTLSMPIRSWRIAGKRKRNVPVHFKGGTISVDQND